MSDDRRERLERFRASAGERLLAISRELVEQRSGDGPSCLRDSIPQELQGLEEQARVLGLGGISNILHELAALLAPEQLEQSGQRSEALELAQQSIDRLVGALCSAAMLAAAAQPEAPGAYTDHDSGQQAALRAAPVSEERIDELCERTTALEARVRALYTQAQRAIGERTASLHELQALFGKIERLSELFEETAKQVRALRLAIAEPPCRGCSHPDGKLARARRQRLRLHRARSSSQLERAILDALREPLLHLIRSAIAPGGEAAQPCDAKPAESSLALRAESAGATIVLALSADGLGGLEAVRGAIEDLGGRVERETAAGAGFRMHLPLRPRREPPPER